MFKTYTSSKYTNFYLESNKEKGHSLSSFKVVNIFLAVHGGGGGWFPFFLQYNSTYFSS